MKKEIHIWMQLLGFDRDAADKGIGAFLERTGFTPDSICGLLFHCDFVNLHRGMEQEYPLFPDNCAYHGIPRNKERERQNWSNHDLRTLVRELKKQGIAFYAGIMGSYLNDLHHHEWLSDHPEMRACRRDKKGGLMCLKRMKDGTYYEEFFAQKLVETLVDYEMDGVHLSDSFCPTSQIYMSDYSTDMVEQFMEHTGLTLPGEILATLGDDATPTVNRRADYIWANLREDWIRFYEWRWERFFRTVCAAAHKAGKQVWVLGMYCTDPFETCYVHAFDSRRAMDAGVDCITANILPTSVGLNAKGYPYYFHRMHLQLPLICAQVGDHEILSMVNLQDASEEWSVLEHRPVQLERDIYTITSCRSFQNGEVTDAAKGVFLCLGDGIDPYHWKFLKSRIDVGFDIEASRVWSPMILWSDHAHRQMLPAYIQTRRTSVHKQSFEIFKAGTPFGGSLRTDQLTGFEGLLFVPNFDLLSNEEQAELIASGIPFLGTVPADHSLPFEATFCFLDRFSDYPLKAFTCGTALSEEVKQKIEALCNEDDGLPSHAHDPELQVSALYGEIPFCKLNNGFIEAMGLALQTMMQAQFPVVCSTPMMAVRLKNGKDRLYLYNPDDDHYDHALVTCAADLKEVKVAGHFPVLPPRFVQQENTAFSFGYNKEPQKTNQFQVKLAPAGMTVVDIE